LTLPLTEDPRRGDLSDGDPWKGDEYKDNDGSHLPLRVSSIRKPSADASVVASISGAIAKGAPTASLLLRRRSRRRSPLDIFFDEERL
jgi:hypothetical protein